MADPAPVAYTFNNKAEVTLSSSFFCLTLKPRVE